MNEKQGITVVQLAIIIVVMIVIISMSVFESPETAKKADFAKRYVEITTLQDAIYGKDALDEIRISGEMMTILGENNAYIDIPLNLGTNDYRIYEQCQIIWTS